MQASEYIRLGEAEQDHWWFRAIRLFLWRLLPIKSGIGNRALDLGSGTGALVREFGERGFFTVGSDVSMYGLAHAAEVYGLTNLIQADANNAPFAAAFDLVVSVDLLEERSVDPTRAVENMLRVLKPGGYALLAAAAHQWLMSEHDRAVNSVRRFTLKDLENLLPPAKTRVLRRTYGFFLLFPLIALWKIINRQKSDRAAISDVSLPPRLINQILFLVCALEAALISRVSLPTGSTALLLVQKI